MLDDYKQEQPIAYKLLVNSIKKNRCSHAYLFETKHYSNKKQFALAFAKYLLCPHLNSNKSQCDQCSQCKRIDEGNFTELKIIEPDGLWIKKDQIDQLQKEFSTKSVESTKKVYIIHDADKMNASAANSILKFLEEPEENIIAILLTDNIYQLLNTIVSRCQIIPLNENLQEENESTLTKVAHIIKNNDSDTTEFIADEKNIDKIKTVVKFVQEYESIHKDVLLSIKQLWFDTFSDKEKMIEGMELLMYFYKDILNVQLNSKIELFVEEKEIIHQLSNQLTMNQVCDRLDVIINLKDYLKVNANINLFMDKLIIKLERRRNHD